MKLNGENDEIFRIDAFLPSEMALRAEKVGITKAEMGPRNTFALGVLAGAFIALGAIFATGQYAFGNGSVGVNILEIANSKCGLDFSQAIALGMVCNALVCLAVWLCFSARSTTDKILSITFPISAFMAAGFEHCVANMYFIPAGLFVNAWAHASFWNTIGKTASEYTNLSWYNFFIANLLPVTIGNITGGSGLVGIAYWFI